VVSTVSHKGVAVYVLGKHFGDRSAPTGRGLLGFAARKSGARRSRRGQATAPVSAPAAGDAGGPPARRDPALRWKNPSQAPAGAFSASAIVNADLASSVVPGRHDTWGTISAFSLTYDGYAYWDDLPELAARSIREWTRDRTLPTSIDEVRGCLFSELRRWHHFGEEPHGRRADYVWALLDTLRLLVPAMARPVSASSAAPRMNRPEAPAAVRSFLNDDPGYLAWTADHGAGFVVNADRTLSPNSLTLHRATCVSLVGAVAAGKTRTGSHRKVCAPDLASLVAWCRRDIGIEPRRCRHCRP
jgi:hypothetical protein